ncbi:MAG: carboxy terminal-processing peptidase [Flavobacteriaceae bacterium]
MRKLRILLPAIVLTALFLGFSSKEAINPDKDKLLLEIISYVLERGHFDPKEINDDFSEQVFMKYMEGLDGQHRFFLQADIINFNRFKNKIDDELKQTTLTFFELTYDRLMGRMDQVKEFYNEILDTPFDFDIQETIDLEYDKLPYATNLNELKNRWRKRFKLSTLDRFVSKKEEEQKKLKEDPTYKMKSDAQLEAEARELTRENIKDYFDLINELDRKDWFSVYVNAIAEQFDPHTFYFAPEEKDRFDTNMSGTYDGIGARLQKKNQEVKIVEVISGGPVWRDKLLDVGDIILKVAQATGDAVEISGMRLDDAIKLIKGPSGTQVILTIKRVDGTIEEVAITRDVVQLEEVYARSSLIQKGDKTFGLIALPKFYINFEDYKERNAATDVKKELEQLKKKGVSGIVLDLRNNGGGSLKTVVDMTGYFIEEGPIVQVKSVGNRKEVLSDTDPAIIWDGPLVVLVNEFSASASEILAAALQDYKRAIVLGSKQTFGKGTVQNMVDLNRIISGNTYGDLGALKITTDKFYRINGGSTQLEGVKSDVVIPDRYQYVDMGEKDQDNPLAWDRISPASYTPWTKDFNFQYAIENSKARLANNTMISLIEEQAKRIKAQQNDYTYSLNYQEFKNEQDADRAASKKFEVLNKFSSPYDFTWLPEADLSLKGSAVFPNKDYAEKRKRWAEDLKKDLYISEAVNILEDMSTSFSGNQKVAQIKQ